MQWFLNLVSHFVRVYNGCKNQSSSLLFAYSAQACSYIWIGFTNGVEFFMNITCMNMTLLFTLSKRYIMCFLSLIFTVTNLSFLLITHKKVIGVWRDTNTFGKSSQYKHIYVWEILKAILEYLKCYVFYFQQIIYPVKIIFHYSSYEYFM